MSHVLTPQFGGRIGSFKITNNIGTLYDEKTANACIELFEKDGYIIDETEHKISFPPPID
jgi:hypothetical protein